MVRIKICGLRLFEDASLASELGAWALGFIRYSKSKRFITKSDLENLVGQLRTSQPHLPKLVAVYVNESIEQIMEDVRDIGLDMVQIHGDESQDWLNHLITRLKAAHTDGELLKEVSVIRALRVAVSDELDDHLPEGVDYFLSDAAVNGEYGGTGCLSDWRIVQELERKRGPSILSGGLDPHNIADAIAQVGCYAYDLASGVEKSPGQKDPHKLRQLFSNLP